MQSWPNTVGSQRVSSLTYLFGGLQYPDCVMNTDTNEFFLPKSYCPRKSKTSHVVSDQYSSELDMNRQITVLPGEA